MDLETEGGGKVANPAWDVIAEALGKLDQGFGNSYAILSVAHNS